MPCGSRVPPPPPPEAHWWSPSDGSAFTCTGAIPDHEHLRMRRACIALYNRTLISTAVMETAMYQVLHNNLATHETKGDLI